MHPLPTISHREAQSLVERALELATALHGVDALIACAVVGASGELVAFGAHDGLGPLPRRLAGRKAYTAVLLRRDTAAAKDSLDAGTLPLGQLRDDELLVLPGGIPIKAGERIAGAIGVSGLTSAQDVEIAQRTLEG